MITGIIYTGGAVKKRPEKKKESKPAIIPMWLITVAIAFGSVIAYYPILNIGFLSDDWVILSRISVGSMADIGGDGLFFRPLVLVSFAVDNMLFGDWAYGFHLVNLLIHVMASIGVAFVAIQLMRDTYIGLIAGLIFALHPIHPEAVTWVAGRYDLFCGAFLIWSLHFHLRSRDDGIRKPAICRNISLALFFLACMSKEMAFGFPLVILLIEFIQPFNAESERTSLKAKLVRFIPYFAIAILWFILRWIRLKGLGDGGYIPDDTGNYAASNLLYQLMLEPFTMLLIPLSRAITSLTEGSSAWVMKIVFLSPLVLFAWKQNWRMIIFCVAAIVVSFLPVAFIGVEELKLESSRFLYTPSIFFAILIASLFSINKFSKLSRRLGTIIGVVYLCTLLIFVHQNNQPWIAAGEMVHSMAVSSDRFVKKQKNTWGNEHKRILAVNVPDSYLGAFVFRWGLPEMLHMRHNELNEVEIDILHEYVNEAETFKQIGIASDEGAIVWAFDFQKR